MAKASRILVVLAALALLPMYAFPIWRISLIAPQYPEGLGMYIRIADVEGVKEHDLTNINELNHYIGMKVIDPAMIPELRWMPYIVGALVAGGLLVAVLGRRKALVGWVATFVAVSAAGLADFWRWNYDYGHNLDMEHAIIKVPGMIYQPPVIGVKQILNFRAASWPHVGGVAAFVAMALAVLALWLAYRNAPRATRREARRAAPD
jgi:copper chaperone NosL